MYLALMQQHRVFRQRSIAVVLLLALPSMLAWTLPPELGLWWPLGAVVLCTGRIFLKMSWAVLLTAFVAGHALSVATHGTAISLAIAITVWHLLFALTKTRVTTFGLQSLGFGLRLGRLSYFALPTTILVLLLSLGHWLIRETLQTSVFDSNPESFLLLQLLTSLSAVFICDMALWTLWGRPRRMWSRAGRPLAYAMVAALASVIVLASLHFTHSRQQALNAVTESVALVSQRLDDRLIQQQELLYDAAAAVTHSGASQSRFEEQLRISQFANTAGLSSLLWVPQAAGGLGTIQLGFPAAKAFHLLGTSLANTTELVDVAQRATTSTAAVSPPFQIGDSTPFYAFALRTPQPRGLVLGLFRAEELIQFALASLQDHSAPQYLQIRGEYSGRIAYQHGAIPAGRAWPQARAQIRIADRGAIIVAAQSPVPVLGSFIHPYITTTLLLGLLTVVAGLALYRHQQHRAPNNQPSGSLSTASS